MTNPSNLNEFVSKFGKWSTAWSLNADRRSRLSRDLRGAILRRLPSHDDKAGVVFRSLTNSEELTLYYQASEKWLRTNGKEIVTGAVTPYWARGWRGISKDYEIENVIAGFFHFAEQYVSRSRIVGFIGALALTYNRDCDYRSHWASWVAIAPDSPFKSLEEVQSKVLSEHGFASCGCPIEMRSQKQRQFLTWVDTINGLDPYVHRAVYQYWRAISLFNAGFYEEGVTALDGLISVGSQFANSKLGFGGTGRSSLGNAYQLTAREIKTLTNIYNLRCDFGAHPSHTKWWDFAEIYESEMDDFRDAAKKLFLRLCEAEIVNRTVHPIPLSWSEWFLDNCVMLLDAVWFAKLRS